MNKDETTEKQPYINPLFSKPLYVKQLNIDTHKIMDLLKKYKFYYDKEKGPNFSQATNSLYVLEDKKLLFLKEQLLKEIKEFAKGILAYKNDFEITTSWFTKTATGQGSSFHNHNNCMFSAVLYLQTKEDCGNLNLQNYDGGRYSLEVEGYNLFNTKTWNITPEDGMLVMFPAEVFHNIQANNSDITRYSLAFNVAPTGLIGKKTTDSHMKIKVVK
jgi:uncharacterized protein (TIGR02466 family)